MNDPLHSLKELVQVARDGAEFYESAQSDVRDPQLRAVFARLAAAKRDLMAALADHLCVAGARVPLTGTLIGSLQRLYAQLRLVLTDHEALAYVEHLEVAEGRLLEHMRHTIAATRDPVIRAQLAGYLPKVHACQDEIRSLRQRLAA